MGLKYETSTIPRTHTRVLESVPEIDSEIDLGQGVVLLLFFLPWEKAGLRCQRILKSILREKTTNEFACKSLYSTKCLY